MNTSIKDERHEFRRFVINLIINDFLVQLSGSFGVFVVFLIIGFFPYSTVIKLVFYGTLLVIPVYFIQWFFIFRKYFSHILKYSYKENKTNVRILVKKLSGFFLLPDIFYRYTLLLWSVGGIVFIIVLKIYAKEVDLARIVISVLSVIGLAPIVAFVSRVVIKRVIGSHLVEFLKHIDDELQLNFVFGNIITLRWIFVNIVYILFYIIFFYSIVSVSITTNIVKSNLKSMLNKYVGEITETIEGFYFSNSSPEELDIYLKTRKMVHSSRITFIDSNGRVYGFPLPEVVSIDDLIIKKSVKDYGILYLYVSLNSFEYFKKYLTRGFIFFAFFLIFLGYVFLIQLGKDKNIELKVLMKNLEKISKSNFKKLHPLYSNDEYLLLNTKVIELKKNFSYLFSKMLYLMKSINLSVNELFSGFESLSLFSNDQSKFIISTRSQVMFLDEFVENITTVTSQLSKIAEEFSHVIVKFVASINEARNETHNLLKLTDSITSSISEISVSQGDLQGQIEQVLTVSERVDRSTDKIMEYIRNLSMENSEAIKKSIMIRNDNEKGSVYVKDSMDSLLKFKEQYQGLLNKVDLQAEEINRIKGILKIIEDLIDETNVLALNASLIAEKNNAQNTGFGVIADSIKDLSERLHVSMSEVSGIISKGLGNFKVIKEIGLNSKRSLSAVEGFLEKASAVLNENEKQLDLLSKSFDFIYVVIDESKMMIGDLIEDLRNIKNFLDSIGYDLGEQKRTTDRIFDFAIDLKDIVEVIKVSYEQMSDSTSTFSFTYHKMRNLSNDLNESIGRFNVRLKEILALLNQIDTNTSGVKDVIIKIEFTLYNINKAMNALNSLFSKVELSGERLKDDEER